MQIGVAEFLENVSKLKKRDEKIQALKMNDSFVLRTTLQAAFDPRIKFLLPEGEVPYNQNKLPDQEGNYINLARKLIYFVEGPYTNMRSSKREQMFIELLEAIDKRDADMLVHIKDKKLPFKGIDANMVKEAFPGLITENEK